MFWLLVCLASPVFCSLPVVSDASLVCVCVTTRCLRSHECRYVLFACRSEEGDQRHADAQEPQSALRAGPVQGPGDLGGPRRHRRQGPACKQTPCLHQGWQEVAGGESPIHVFK